METSAMRLIAPQDRVAVEAWIGEWADPKQGRELVPSLPSLARGAGWVWSPEIGMLERVAFPKIKTFDSSRAPEDGETFNVSTDLAAIDIGAIKSALAVKAAEEKTANKVSVADIKAAEKQGFERGYREGLVEGRRAGLEDAVNAIYGLAGQAKSEHKPLAVGPHVVGGARENAEEVPVPSPKIAQARSASGGAELRVLRVLAARHPARFTKAQWATLARMKRTGGTWANYVSLLRKAGYLDERGDMVGLTAAGLSAAGNVERPAPGTVIQQWKAALGSGPAKMIDVLIDAYPRQMDRANLADRVNMTATGGTFANYLSLLKTNGLVEVSGRKIKADPTLFLDAGEQAA
jgi:uncharacterized protein